MKIPFPEAGELPICRAPIPQDIETTVRFGHHCQQVALATGEMPTAFVASAAGSAPAIVKSPLGYGATR